MHFSVYTKRKLNVARQLANFYSSDRHIVRRLSVTLFKVDEQAKT